MQHDNTKEQELHLLVRSVGMNNVVQPLVTFCISIIIARMLGPQGRGSYGIVVALIATLPMVASLGLSYATRFFSAGGSISRAALLKSTSMIGAILGTVMAVGVILAWWTRHPQAFWPDNLGAVGITALALTLFLTGINRFWTFYMAGRERYAYNTWFTTAGYLLQAGGLLTAWWVGVVSLDVAVAVLLLPAAFRFLLFPILARDELRPAWRTPCLSFPELRRMLHFGSWAYLSGILELVHTQLIIFLLSVMSGLFETGLYTVIIGPASILLLFSSPLTTVLSSRTTRRIGDAGFARQVAASLRLVFAVTGSAALIGLLLAPTLIPWIFGPAFKGAVMPFCLLLPGYMALALNKVMVQFLFGAGRPRRATVVSATTAAVTLVLAPILLPRFGAAGAAAAVTTALLCSTVVSARAFLDLSGLRWRELCRPQSEDWWPIAKVLGISSGRRT